jgi:hypothetical protein
MIRRSGLRNEQSRQKNGHEKQARKADFFHGWAWYNVQLHGGSEKQRHLTLGGRNI